MLPLAYYFFFTPLILEVIARGLVTAAPTLGTPSSPGVVRAIPVTSSSPTLGTPSSPQENRAVGLVAGVPILVQPATNEITRPVSLFAGPPRVGTPFSRKVGVARGLVIPAPRLSQARVPGMIAFLCAPDIYIEKSLINAIISPTADLRLKITLIRTTEDIDVISGVPTDYQNSQPEMLFHIAGDFAAPIARLTLGTGIERSTNNSDEQIFVALLEQSVVNNYRGQRVSYRFTITTAFGAKVSGGQKKTEYSGIFSIDRS